MPTILARICYLCYAGKGELKLAIARYEIPTGAECDVCEDCLENVKKNKFPYRSIEGENVIEQKT